MSMIYRNVDRQIGQKRRKKNSESVFAESCFNTASRTNKKFRYIIRNYPNPSSCSSDLDLKWRDTMKKPLLTEKHVTKRLIWAHENIDRDFSNVIFTDECSI